MEKLIDYSTIQLINEGKLQLYYDKVKDMSEEELLRQIIYLRRKNRSDRFYRLLFGLIKDKFGLTGDQIEKYVEELAQHI